MTATAAPAGQVDRNDALARMLTAADEAAAIILRIYAGAFDVDYKSKDDPVTRADKEANALIVDRLARAFPGVPIVAEESDPSTFEGYSAAREVFFVDPLDGTREFVARNGEFCIMIGLAQEGRATAGVILLPSESRTFAAARGAGAFEIKNGAPRTPIHVSREASLAKASVVVSRSQRPSELDDAEQALGVARVTMLGSAGVKAVRVAAGEADVYAHPGRGGMLWDLCAPDAIVTEAGGLMTDGDGSRFDYRTPELRSLNGMVASNGLLHDGILAALARMRPSR